MAEAFELYASFKIDTSGYTQELNKIRQEMQQFQQELNSLAIHPTFDGGRFQKELQQAQQQSTQATEEIQRLQQQIQSLQQAADGGDSGGGVLSGFLSRLDVIGDIASGQFLANMAVNGINSIIDGVTGSIDESIGLASDLKETQNVVDVTFEDSASTINKWSQEALNAYGITETKAKQYSSTLGAMMKSMGIADDQVLQMSMDMAGLAADMASFYNLDHDTAFEKIRSGISGETEPLKALGINMSVANLNAFALEKGMNKAFDKMSQAEQATLRYQYLLEATKDAQGDFARTGDSFSNEMRKLQTNLDRIKTEFGKGLLGVVTPAISLLNNVLSDKSYQQTAIEKIYSERDESLFAAEVAYQRSLTIVDSMRSIEDESGDAVKSTEEWRAALEALKDVMPGLSQYVDLTTDAIIGNDEAIQNYVDTLHGVTKYNSYDQAVSDAQKRYDDLQTQIAETEADIAKRELLIQSSDELQKLYDKRVEDAWRTYAQRYGYEPDYQTARNMPSSDVRSYAYATSTENPYANLGGLATGLNAEQIYYFDLFRNAQNAAKDPLAQEKAELESEKEELAELVPQAEAAAVALDDVKKSREEYVNSPEGRKAKLNSDFKAAVDAEKKALEDLKTTVQDVYTYQEDALKKMQKSYKGVASGFGFMVKHTRDEMQELLNTTYSEENVMGWWEQNANVLEEYNAQLREARDAGLDTGIIEGLLTYSTENEATLARYLDLARNNPDAIAALNAKYARVRAAENDSAAFATEITLANDETYQSMLSTMEKALESFDQKDAITAYMAENDNALLAGIDDMRKTLEAEIPGINALLEQLGFKTIDYEIKDKPWVHDFGGARAGYADLFDDVAKDKNAFNKDEAKALHAIEARARSGYADMIEDGLMPDDIKARAQRWNRLVEMKTQEMNDIVDILEQRMEENQRQLEAEEAARAAKEARDNALPKTWSDLSPIISSEEFQNAESYETVSNEKTTGGNIFSAIESAIDAAKEIESRTIQEGFVTQSIFNTLGEMMENYKESLKNNSAPNIFNNGDGVLFVQVTNPDEIANAVSGLPPTTINNTFSVDGKTVATAVAPIVNKTIGRGIRGNLMEVAR